MMRTHLGLAAFAALSVTACTDKGVTTPAADGILSGPSFAISDAGNSGPVEGFWFLPPLAKQVTTEGILDPGLEPSMEVCELDGNPSADVNDDWADVACRTVGWDDEPPVEGGPPVIVTRFLAGSASVTPDANYQFSWDTDAGPENLSPMDSDEFYRIHILIDTLTLGSLDVNPQRPSGESPGEDFADLYAFRIGETLPVKFFINPQVRCSLADEEVYVVQCTAQGVIDDAGGVVTLDPVQQEGWVTISTVVPQFALPEGFESVILTMERIRPDLFFAETGEHCIPGFGVGLNFDAPQFGDCLRITTDPELPDGLAEGFEALIEICIDPLSFAGLKFGQDEQIQIIRYEGGVTQALPNEDATTCPTVEPAPDQLGFLPVPRNDGFLRTAAIAFNTVARWMGPEPLAAHGDIRLAGSTTEFSRYRWGLTGLMLKEAGDESVIQQLEDGSESYDVTVQVKVVDAAAETVEDAVVHFSGDGVVGSVADTTGSDGIAEFLWNVPDVPAEEYTLDAQALGLLDLAVQDQQHSLLDFEVASVQFTATVIGGPSTATQSPPADTELSGLPGETLETQLTVTAFDTNGLPVSGWDVTWDTGCAAADPETCDGSVSGDGVTGSNGSASGYWTLATTPGTNTLTVYVGDVALNFVAGSWSATGLCEVIVNGEVGDGEWDCAEAAGDVRSFTANISGGDTPAEVRWQHDGENLYFLVLVEQSSLAKVNSLRIDFDNDPNGVTAGPSGDDDAIGFDAGGGGFLDEHLTDKCVNRSQSGCGSEDVLGPNGGVDGEGAIGNDGMYTVYELSHPLQGTPGEDFVVSSSDELGLYLTLRIGNGAQGNMQYPGFRDYLDIIIR